MSEASKKIGLLTQPPAIDWLSGPEKGRRIELAGRSLVLGRGTQADIQVAGDGVSRTHAILACEGDRWFIRDNQSKNGVQVNGKTLPEAWLENGDIVQVGSTVFRFSAPESEGESPDPVGAPEASVAGEFFQEKPKANPRRRLILIGSVGVLLLVIIASLGGNSDKTEQTETPTETTAVEGEVAKEPDLNFKGDPTKPKGRDPIDDAEKEMAGLDWSNSSLREAESLFRKGQREYLNKNYQRAIDLFKESVLLSREHKLAQLYLARATFAAETAAKLNMQLGVRYFRSLQYQRAMFHFAEAIHLMEHKPKDKFSKDAERYIAQCRRRLQAAGIFP